MKKASICLLLILFISFGCKQKQSDQTAATDNDFQLVDIKKIRENPVALFADNWFVVTAGNDSAYNQMTISWGALGSLWNSPVATIYIRDSRYTYQFIDKGKYFTLCAFDDAYREKVLYIGSHSGKDSDKLKVTGLTPLKTKLGNIFYKEARLVLECEKIYSDDLHPENILDSVGKNNYKNTDSKHRMFIGKILNVWEKK